MTDVLAGIRLKIERAEFHRQAIEDEARPWIEQQQSVITREHESGSPWFRFVVHRVDPTPPPLVWGVMLGDLIHNLRSALDHIVWQLVIANEQTPSKSNQFPIFSHKPKPGSLEAYLRGVAAAPTAKIKQFQPYNRSKRSKPELLEVIAALSNTDKHQTLHPVAVITGRLVTSGDVRLTTGSNPDQRPFFRWGRSLGEPIDGAELLAVRLTPPGGDVYLEGESPMGASVAFGESGQVPFGQVTDLITEVRRIFGVLEPFIR